MEEKAGDLLFKLGFKLVMVLVHWWNIEPGAGETCGYFDAAGNQGNDAAGDRLEDEKRVWHRHHQQHTALVMVTITIMSIFSVQPRAPIIITMIIAEHVITGATLGPDQGLIYFPGALPLPLAPPALVASIFEYRHDDYGDLDDHDDDGVDDVDDDDADGDHQKCHHQIWQ